MKKVIIIFSTVGLFIFSTTEISAFKKANKFVKLSPQSFKELKAKASALETIFFDDFETEKGWTVMDIAVQNPKWHISTYQAYLGNSWWCGEDQDTVGWASPPGYGDGWVQMLISPTVDLTSVTADTVLIRYMHYYSVEPPGAGEQQWDCCNVWASIDSGQNWTILFPDTVRYPGSAYNVSNSYAWHYTGLVPDWVPISGWGGTNSGWSAIGFDLSSFKGSNLWLRFAVVSDPLVSDQTNGTFHGAWYLDNIQIDTVSAGGSSGTIFYDDAESGPGNWVATSKTPRYLWHKVTTRAHSPTQSWWAGVDTLGSYLWCQSDAIVSPVIDLREAKTTDSCYVNFWVWAHLPDTGGPVYSSPDYYVCDISADTGRNWQGITPYISWDNSQTWLEHNQSVGPYLDISSWAGKTVQIRIAFLSDGDSLVDEGLYIDDFIVKAKTREPLPPPSTVLIVDDDFTSAIDVYENRWTKYFENSLANLGYRFSEAIVGYHKDMDSTYLRKFPVAIWNIGASYYEAVGGKGWPLSDKEKEHIMAYLRTGGNFWLSGKDYMWTVPPTPELEPLVKDYFHLLDRVEDIGCSFVYGIPGDSLSSELDTIYLDYGHLNGDGWGNDYADKLIPDSTLGARGAFFNPNGNYSAIHYHDATLGYKALFTAFAFEAINTPTERDTIMARIMNWFLTESPDYIPPASPESLKAQVVSPNVILTWLTNSEPDLAGYNIYRGTNHWGPYTNIGTKTIPDTTFTDTTTTIGVNYFYVVTAYDNAFPANESWYSNEVNVMRTSILDAEGIASANLPQKFGLLQNYPNPFTSATEIRYTVGTPEHQSTRAPAMSHEPRAISHTTLKIYNLAGQLVRILVNEPKSPGVYKVIWDGRDESGKRVTEGVYFYRLTAGDLEDIKKMILVR
ncbi:MAG: FlgD immunoglobulin-like domain containing protein [Candidatus Edwardsbacteria bacterium]